QHPRAAEGQRQRDLPSDPSRPEDDYIHKLASDGGAPAPRRPAARTATFIGSPRTAGPQPRDVLRLALQRPSRAVPAVDHHDVLAHAAVVVGQPDRGVRDLAGAGLVAELDEDLRGLGHAGGAERMAAADQAAPRI